MWLCSLLFINRAGTRVQILFVLTAVRVLLCWN
jgi:hypothetical protein